MQSEFKKDPRAWALNTIESLMKEDARLMAPDRASVLKARQALWVDEKKVPGPNMYDMLCKIARRCGAMPRRARLRSLRDARAAGPPPKPVPARFALGAPIPRPPRLSRPPETWDPAGNPGR